MRSNPVSNANLHSRIGWIRSMHVRDIMSYFKWWNPVRSIVRKAVRPRSKRGTKKPTSRRRLAVEVLEDRNLPSSSFSQAFVEQTYADLLHRSADPSGLAAWTSLIDQGLSPRQFVLDIEASAENRADLVESAYESLLGRTADAAGLSFWTNFLQNNPVQLMQAAIIGSAEFFQRAGGTSAAFLNAIDEDVLGRAIDTNAQTFFEQQLVNAGVNAATVAALTNAQASFEQQLNAGVGNAAVAAEILGSQEHLQDLVNSYYNEFLGRTADPAGLAHWVGVLGSLGGSQQAVIADIIASPESVARAAAALVGTAPAPAQSIAVANHLTGGAA